MKVDSPLSREAEQCLVRPSSVNLPVALDGSKWGDPRADNVQRV